MHLSRALVGVTAASLMAVTPASAASRPDLRVVGLTDPPSQLAIGQQFSTDIVVKNVGKAASSRGGQTAVSLVEDPHRPKNLVPLGHVTMPRLKAGHTSTKTIRVQLPAGMHPGRYFLWICADSTKAVTESNERNNCMSSAIDMQVIAP